MAAFNRVVTPPGTGGGPFPALQLDWANGQALSLTTSPVSSSAFSARVIALSTSVDCYISIDAGSPSTVGASAGSLYLPKGEIFFMVISAGDIVSAVAESGSGTLTIVPAADADSV